jgi:hypothetical protein
VWPYPSIGAGQSSLMNVVIWHSGHSNKRLRAPVPGQGSFFLGTRPADPGNHWDVDAFYSGTFAASPKGGGREPLADLCFGDLYAWARDCRWMLGSRPGTCLSVSRFLRLRHRFAFVRASLLPQRFWGADFG